ncbi:glycosyltransferase family A protein [Algoriphagus confluentis]|uniref:Glycosyltransferase family 2 protein n=1 Tax=Algoriphagus confluentis TaxID=1697556 RepID=A0ABQ6PUA2_9BACT|nr:hypothetical protein Aconfl_41940 [Algoriphagus confluentis]
MKNTPPLLSVVIPVFNCADFLNETIESVFLSSYKSFELILVNDGSVDRSLEICLDWKNLYPDQIRVIHQRNQGPSVARNHGIENANGKYILPLDADDKIHSDYMSEAIDFLEKNPDTKLVYCLAEKFGIKQGPWNLKSFSLSNLALDNMIFVSGVYRKKDWEKTGGYDPRFLWGWEDWEFWINFLKNGGKVYRLPFVGFYYRTRKGSRRKSTDKKGKELTICLLNKKHPEFFERYLNGPLRNPRGSSIYINRIQNFILWINTLILKKGEIEGRKKRVPNFQNSGILKR